MRVKRPHRYHRHRWRRKQITPNKVTVNKGDGVTNGAKQSESTALQSLVQNFGRLGRDGMSSLLAPWLVIAAIDFGFVAISIAAVWIAGTADPTTGVGVLMQLVGVVQVVAVMTLRVALLNTLREVAFGGPGSMDRLGAVVGDVRRRLGPAFVITVVLGIIVSIGMVLCVLPGLLALFFFAFAPYLVVSRNYEIVESLRESAKWAAREWALILSALVVAVIAAGAIMVVTGIISAVGLRPTMAVPVGLVGAWVLNTVVGYLAFLWWGAVYVTAESRQQLETLRRTAPSGPTTYEMPEQGG